MTILRYMPKYGERLYINGRPAFPDTIMDEAVVTAECRANWELTLRRPKGSTELLYVTASIDDAAEVLAQIIEQHGLLCARAEMDGTRAGNDKAARLVNFRGLTGRRGTAGFQVSKGTTESWTTRATRKTCHISTTP